MAVLSVPSNTPTLDGATAVCTSDDATGTVYLSVRTDRQWYSVANGDSQGLADADKAVIIAGTTDSNIVFAANQAASLDPELTIDGLAARLDPANPYYVGWVQADGPEGPDTYFYTGTAGYTYTRASPAMVETNTGLVLSRDSDLSLHPQAVWSGSEYTYAPDTSEGILVEGSGKNLARWCRDQTGAAWDNPNITAVLDAVGVDGGAATTLTATADSATSLQSITSAEATRTFAMDIRSDAVTSVDLTVDGTNYTPVTISSTWSRQEITAAAITNPIFGIRLASSGDSVEVDFAQLENSIFSTSRILTQSTTMTRAGCEFDGSIGLDLTQDFCFYVRLRPAYALGAGTGTRELFSLSSSGGDHLYVRHRNNSSCDIIKQMSGETAVTDVGRDYYSYDKNESVIYKVKQDSSGLHFWGVDNIKRTSTTGVAGSAFLTPLDALTMRGAAERTFATIERFLIVNEALDDSVIEGWT